jgi:hypothetical protein
LVAGLFASKLHLKLAQVLRKWRAGHNTKLPLVVCWNNRISTS